MAPGMGLNTFFAVVVSNIVTLTGTTYTESFQAALCIMLLEGVLFLIICLMELAGLKGRENLIGYDVLELMMREPRDLRR